MKQCDCYPCGYAKLALTCLPAPVAESRAVGRLLVHQLCHDIRGTLNYSICAATRPSVMPILL